MSPGAQVGPYTIERELGRGGMGVVYLAQDARLGRLVAIKAMPEHLASDPDRLARFEREARTLAQLSHPNVGGIYGVEEHEGARFLVLEYIEGRSLAEVLDGGALPIDEAVEYGMQIASGVEAAHESGIVHRDLKPGNVIVTPEGHATVLDFGLARIDEGHSSSSLVTESPTLTSPAGSPTVSGVILGTAAYMSPEQARGRRVDKRTDIWSFGVMLYEMLSGSSPFVGETIGASIGAVLHKDPDLERLPKSTPTHVRRVLKRCLARDPRDRYRDIGDVRFDLQAGEDEGERLEHATGRSRGLLWGVIAVLGTALAVVSFVLLTGSSAPPAEPMHFSIDPPAECRIVFSGDLAGPPVVSPDGSRVVFCASREGETRRLWVRDLGAATPRELPGTEGALFPFWSPDARQVGFFTVDALKRLDFASETVQRVCAVNQSRGGAWTDDGRIILSRNFRGALFVVDAAGGEPEPLTTLNEDAHTSHRWPFHIPGTDRFLFSAVSARPREEGNNGVYLGTLDSEAEPVRVLRSDFGAAYHAGHLLHVRNNVLLATPLDVETGETPGDDSVLARDINPDLSTWHAQFSASEAGVLVYNRRPTAEEESATPTGYSWSVEGDRVTLFNSLGSPLTTYAADTPVRSIALSPDGSMLAIDVISENGFMDIWLYPTAWTPEPLNDETALGQAERFRTEPRRFTFLEGPEVEPTWSPDGREIAFRWAGESDRPRGIYRKRVGGGAEVLVYDSQGGDDYPEQWTADGRYLITVSGTLLVSEHNDIWAVSVESGEATLLVGEPGADTEPRVSPDGRWLAYTHASSGRGDVYVVPFAPAWPEGTLDRRWLVSENGGSQPRWSADGDQLFYITGASILVAIDVDTSGESFQFSGPRALFQSPWDVGRDYEPTPDRLTGECDFLFVNSAEKWDAPIAAILNWRTLLGE